MRLRPHAHANRPARVADDRGEPVTVAGPADIAGPEQRGDAARTALARRLRYAVDCEAHRATPGRLALGACAIVLWMTLVLTVIALPGRRTPPALTLIAFFAGPTGIGLLIRAMARRAVTRELALTAVAEGICGSCGYTLEHLHPEPDGCIICPECGAAWKRLRLTWPHWLADQRPQLPGPPFWIRALYSIPRVSHRLAPDDRGRFVCIPDSRLRALPPQRRDQIGPARLAALVRRLRRIGRIRRIAVALIPISVGGLVTAAAIIAHRDNGPSKDQLLLCCMAVFFILCGIAIGLAHSFYNLKAAARTLTADSLCGCCGRTLQELAPAEDGLVVCPDCGAAWQPPAGSHPDTRHPPLATLPNESSPPDS